MTEIIPYHDPFSLCNQLLAQDPRLGSENTRDADSLAFTQFGAWRNDRFFSKLAVEAYLSELQDQSLAPDCFGRSRDRSDRSRINHRGELWRCLFSQPGIWSVETREHKGLGEVKRPN